MITQSIPPRKKKRKSASMDNPAPEQQIPEENNEKEQTIEHQTIVNEQEQDQAVNQSDRLLEGGKEGFMD